MKSYRDRNVEDAVMIQIIKKGSKFPKEKKRICEGNACNTDSFLS